VRIGCNDLQGEDLSRRLLHGSVRNGLLSHPGLRGTTSRDHSWPAFALALLPALSQLEAAPVAVFDGEGAAKGGHYCRRVAKTAQIWTRPFCHTAAMTTQTIAQYLDEERQKATDTQLRTEEEAARIQPLQHGHHRTAKQPKVELLPPVKAVTKKKKTAAVARKKPRASGKMAAKTRKRA